MQRARWKYLLHRSYEQTASPEEQAELMAALREGGPDEAILDELIARHRTDVALPGTEADALYHQILAQLPAAEPVRQLPYRKWWWVAAVAAGLLFPGGAAYFMNHQKRPSSQYAIKADVPPGTNRAVLTLADGTQVALDSSGRQVIQQGNTAVRQQNGELRYEVKNGSSEVSYNVLTTPRGGQFRLVLPDNSAVWLNAASSIRYPTAFAGKERLVTVTGEAYFEVAPVPGQPFRVSLPAGVSVEVLGTHFNVNAYTEENSIRATLISGKVQVLRGNDKILLQPGQQVQADPRAAGIVVTPLLPAGVSQVTAWKNGIFDFEKMDLEQVLQQVARWYDVEVIYKGPVPHRLFGGQLSRSLRLSDIVEVMRMMKVNVHIEEGKRLVVQSL
ncbi:FecR domain-containing protein [Chitinophaga sp. OAE865]|uniref:FecR family protein n=1 Tax=Chitinophaga sp. OAE865 TaxID=2817898 RepID=UPI001AE3C133